MHHIPSHVLHSAWIRILSISKFKHGDEPYMVRIFEKKSKASKLPRNNQLLNVRIRKMKKPESSCLLFYFAYPASC
jgi:hypothetical protein